MIKSFIRSYWKSIFICIVIFILSIIKFSSIPDVAKFRYSDKLVHLLLYMTWALFIYYEFTKDLTFKIQYKRWYFFLLLFPVFFGAFIEVIQGLFFRPRSAEILDWVADIVGSILGFVIAYLLIRKKNDQ